MKAFLILFLIGFLGYMFIPRGFGTMLILIFVGSMIVGAVTEYNRQENDKS